MKFLAVVFLFVAVSAKVIPVSQYGQPEDRIEGEYVVKFENGARAEFEQFKKAKNSFIRSPVVVREFGDYMGFGGPLTDEELWQVQTLAGVEYIEQNMRFYALQSSGEQTNVQAWGIDRSDQTNLPLNRIYRWANNGAGVDVFVLDTGIFTGHNDFGGRARFLSDCTGFFGCSSASDPGDPNGHGTHCAGTVASNTYGIAKAATVHNVRVLGDNGSGSTNGIMNGITLVNNRAGKRIISMSLGGGFSRAFNDAVDASHRAGVVNVVAAGNSNSDACNASPASAPLAVTVGATDIQDRRSSFSSFGSCVDLFAPGTSILSTSRTGGTATFSGTSMACPHVAGAVALIHSRGTFSADQVVSTLLSETTSGRVTNPGSGSPNELLFTSP